MAEEKTELLDNIIDSANQLQAVLGYNGRLATYQRQLEQINALMQSIIRTENNNRADEGVYSTYTTEILQDEFLLFLSSDISPEVRREIDFIITIIQRRRDSEARVSWNWGELTETDLDNIETEWDSNDSNIRSIISDSEFSDAMKIRDELAFERRLKQQSDEMRDQASHWALSRLQDELLTVMIDYKNELDEFGGESLSVRATENMVGAMMDSVKSRRWEVYEKPVYEWSERSTEDLTKLENIINEMPDDIRHFFFSAQDLQDLNSVLHRDRIFEDIRNDLRIRA